MTLNQEIDCSIYTSCGECTSHLECGYCVATGECVQGSWDAPFKNRLICSKNRWEYEYAQLTHQQALISITSALFDEERSPLLLGDSIATNHFRRASFYNYNRNRPFERRTRTVSIGTANNISNYGRNWRNSTTDDYLYGGYGYNYGGYGNLSVGYGTNGAGYAGHANTSVVWVNNDTPDVSPPTSSTTNNSNTHSNNNNVSHHTNDFLPNNGFGNMEWRRWEKKREELLSKYAKSINE
nr:11324_t:CDS:2 [Entrophospora candida]CAG8531391.1 8475_t:CDS:2 [Entrophospora candida]